MDGRAVAAIVGGVAVYALFFVLIIRWSLKWARKRMAEKNDAIVAGLGDAKPVGDTKRAALYSGTETEYDVGGRRVVLSTYYQNRSWVRTALRIAAGPFPNVTVFPENGFERLGKAIGLNREVQTGDKAFDDLAYLDTVDTDENVRRAFEPAGVRGAVAELLSLGYRVQLGAEGVEAFQMVRAGESIDGSKARLTVEQLGRLVDALPTFGGSHLAPSRKARHAVLGVSLVLVSMLGIVVLGMTDSSVDRTLDEGLKMSVFVLGGGLVWALFVGALVAAVRGRSYAMRLVTIGAVFGVLGIPAGAGSLLLWLNQELDRSADIEHVAEILDHKLLKKGRCRLTVPDWHEGAAGKLKLYVSHKSDQELKAGTTVVVRSHPGRFGWEWYEKLRPDGS